MFRTLAAKDPALAAAKFMELQTGNERGIVVHTIASKWAQSDPAAALAWVQTLPESEHRSTALSTVLREWAGSDPGAAKVACATLPEGQGKQQAVASVAGRWARNRSGIRGRLGVADELRGYKTSRVELGLEELAEKRCDDPH